MRKNELTKAWLWGYRDALREWVRRTQEYMQLTETQEAAGAIRYDSREEKKTPGTADGRDLSELMVAREELESRIREAEGRMAKAMAERASAIDTLPSLAQREVLSMRYIQLTGGKPYRWQEIAAQLGYSEQYVLDLHGQALESISQVIERKKVKDPSKSE